MFADSPTTIGNLGPGEFQRRLRGLGIGVRIGPFDLHIKARVDGLDAPLQRLYRDYPLLDDERVFSGHVEIRDIVRLYPRPARRIRFTVDGRAPHEDMPAGQGLAVLEWGLNLLVALRFHRFLMLHAAAVERRGHAMLLPAWPGHGKTTLCAALVHRGWRLLSDEFGLVRPGSTCLTPVPRPMPLKNESIEVLRAFAPEAVLGPSIPNTRKGTVAHVRAPASSVLRAGEEVPAAWLVFPRWVAGAPLALEEIPRMDGFMQLATNAFNFEMLGATAFETARAIVDGVRCYRLVYSDLASAVATLTDMADGIAG